jgi:TPR repeat protein
MRGRKLEPPQPPAEQTGQQKRSAMEAKLERDKGEYEQALKSVVDLSVWPQQLRFLAERGNTAAQDSIALSAWLDGDLKSAVGWYEKAANQGSTQAMNQLGRIYSGDVIFRTKPHNTDPFVDPAKALSWYHTSAAMGDAQAMMALGATYEDGSFTIEDFTEAKKWYLMAAQSGWNNAGAHSLARMYESGKDFVQSHMWHNIACVDSVRHPIAENNGSCLRRNFLENRMNSADILKAQALASSWVKIYRK